MSPQYKKEVQHYNIKKNERIRQKKNVCLWLLLMLLLLLLLLLLSLDDDEDHIDKSINHTHTHTHTYTHFGSHRYLAVQHNVVVSIFTLTLVMLHQVVVFCSRGGKSESKYFYIDGVLDIDVESAATLGVRIIWSEEYTIIPSIDEEEGARAFRYEERVRSSSSSSSSTTIAKCCWDVWTTANMLYTFGSGWRHPTESIPSPKSDHDVAVCHQMNECEYKRERERENERGESATNKQTIDCN